MFDLPASAPAWLSRIPWQWLAGVAIVLGAWLLHRLIVRGLSATVADAELRHRYRKRTAYGISLLALAALSLVLFEAIRGIGTLLGFMGAGLAIALREYLASLFAWMYLLGNRGIVIGRRIEAGGVRGDVIDLGLFKITLVEVGGTGLGGQSSGRLVTVPNYKLLTDPVVVYALGTPPFVWDEIDFLVEFEADWERGRGILEEIGHEVVEPYREEIEAGFRELEREYAHRRGATTPIVYVAVMHDGVQLKLRYLTLVRGRRGNRDRITRRVLTRFGEAGIRFARPHVAPPPPAATDAPEPSGLGSDPFGGRLPG